MSALHPGLPGLNGMETKHRNQTLGPLLRNFPWGNCGHSVLDNFTLFAANAIVVLVMAMVFFIAGRARNEVYWDSWGLANVVIGFALLTFMFERFLPDVLTTLLPNSLLVLGFSLRWQAARQFEKRSAPRYVMLLPAVVFVAFCAVPPIYSSYASVYSTVNIVLTVLAAGCTFEFWRNRSDRKLSRTGMIIAYGVLTGMFAARTLQGLLATNDMARHIPDDAILTIHLSVALFHVTASGAFALALAYERDATELRRLASRDGLTGLLNRSAFETRAMAFIRANPELPFALAIFDLDHFKRINDLHGHAAGDRTLVACAQAFDETFDDNAIVARWGGEEFVALLSGLSSAEAAHAVETLRAKISRLAVPADNTVIHPSLSAGICHSDCGSRDLEHLLSHADSGLYAAKKSGRNRVKQIVNAAA
ncbi:GGDEF domain-containing protein [Nitratireductor aquimarinus]|uniref:GGDEF domain-containing protein n=1 Tax=Nitratireductor aquimarinus TaxID=889300 RepID=UPI001A8C517E|nr:GGDEF domain-containing protein [Nitratireductor aquimarinus]MBN8242995.1 GGDEF domain-containing protein [Nitratireductor aquimarinus]MBY6132096.1 GGDEF domain-containing protein [Nitratireductor aquimarinus]MCA1301632.1 GGDEF domain-containing protein [Nitratireductor aquimarinus]